MTIPLRHGNAELTDSAVDTLTSGRPPRSRAARRSILFLRGADLSNITGARDIEVLPELRLLGWDPALLAIRTGDTEAWLPGVTIHSVPLPPIPFLGSIIANIAAGRWVLKLRPDVLLVAPSYVLAVLLASPFLSGTTVIADVRSVPIPGNGWLHDLLGPLQLRLALRLPRLRGVTAITDGTAQVLRTRYRMSPRLPMGIWSSAADTKRFNPSVRPIDRGRLGISQPFIFVYHGHLTLLRGLGTLLHALSRVRRRHDVGLILLGAGKDLVRLRTMAEDLAVDEAVGFVPTVPADEVPRFLAAADAGVIPLPDLWWWAISSPLKLYEYMAMGLPVVATDIAAHRAAGNAVVLAKPTADGLAEAMAAVVTGTAVSGNVDRAALSWARQAQALATFMELVDGGRTPRNRS